MIMIPDKIGYVLGFAFNQTLDQVVLIQKRRGPVDMIGKFNGIGGKIESFDVEHFSTVNDPVATSVYAAHRAMIREFNEETGAISLNWTWFAKLYGRATDARPSWDIHVFYTVLSEAQWNNVTTNEDEFVIKAQVKNLPSNCMRNLQWLIPMAQTLDHENIIVHYEIVPPGFRHGN